MSSSENTVAVVGAGLMGSGIAQCAAVSGYDVRLRDVGEAELVRAVEAIEKSLARLIKADRLTRPEADAAIGRIITTVDLRACVEEATIVIEAVPEVLSLKQDVLEEVARAAPAAAVFGTNTSQLSITEIGSALGDEAPRVVGTHFFNPPVLMRLVELVRGRSTSDESLETMRAFVQSLDKEVVVCLKDEPGFITTRAYSALRLECLRILEDGVASAEDIDRALRLGFNFPVGPLELGDSNGLDLFLQVADALAEAHGERFRATEQFRRMVEAGRVGRKAGEGFYRYGPDGRRLD